MVKECAHNSYSELTLFGFWAGRRLVAKQTLRQEKQERRPSRQLALHYHLPTNSCGRPSSLSTTAVGPLRMTPMYSFQKTEK